VSVSVVVLAFSRSLWVCTVQTRTRGSSRKKTKRFWLPMSAYGAVINEGIRLLTQRRVKREPASCTQPVQPCCFISFLSLQKRREETGGIFSTGNVWQRRQDTLWGSSVSNLLCASSSPFVFESAWKFLPPTCQIALGRLWRRRRPRRAHPTSTPGLKNRPDIVLEKSITLSLWAPSSLCHTAQSLRRFL
jgi:hypothetical protein